MPSRKTAPSNKNLTIQRKRLTLRPFYFPRGAKAADVTCGLLAWSMFGNCTNENHQTTRLAARAFACTQVMLSHTQGHEGVSFFRNPKMGGFLFGFPLKPPNKDTLQKIDRPMWPVWPERHHPWLTLLQLLQLLTANALSQGRTGKKACSLKPSI